MIITPHYLDIYYVHIFEKVGVNGVKNDFFVFIKTIECKSNKKKKIIPSISKSIVLLFFFVHYFAVMCRPERKSKREIYLFILIKQQQLHCLLNCLTGFFSLREQFFFYYFGGRERESLVFLSFIHSFTCSTLAETTYIENGEKENNTVLLG